MSSKLQKRLKKPLIIRRVTGHSMLPVLPPHTLVIATSLLKLTKKNTVVIICHDNKEKIKRLQDVHDGQVYVVGDNALASTDSRQFGWIPIETVIARVVWPRKLR
jgi:nickel-type superoxide dismutase maturation protease